MSKEAIKMADFKRDMHKYFVMKQSDICFENKYQRNEMQEIINQYEQYRAERGAGSLECVVVESDWGIYEQVWELVEKESTGKPTTHDALVQHNAELEEKLRKFEQALADQVYRDTMLTDMAVRDGGINLSLEGGACQLLANSFAEQFKESGATNYLEMSFDSMDANIGELVVTMQRKDGDTPGQLRSVAEVHNAELTEALELCHQTLEEFIGFDENGTASNCMASIRAALSKEQG